MSGSWPAEQASAATAQPPTALPPPETHRRRHRWLLIPVVALILAAGLLLVATIRVTERHEPPANVVRFTLPFPNDTQPLDGAQFAVSPDGTTVALAARADANGQSQLWVRRLQGLDWRELPRTDGAAFPFWSPDSRHVGFFADRRLKRIDVESGLTQTVCDAANGSGGAWGQNDAIVFADGHGPLFRVPASGGSRKPITKLDSGRGEISHHWPQFLGDGHHFVFFADSAEPRNRRTYIAETDAEGRAELTPAGVAVAADDRLLLSRDTVLVAQRVDIAHARIATNDVRTIAGAEAVGGDLARGPSVAAARSVLLYRNASPRLSQLIWLDAGGRAVGRVGDPNDDHDAALSPDGRAVAVARPDARTARSNLWLIDLARGSNQRLTFGDGEDRYPVWSPDGTRIAFASRRNGEHVLMTISTNGGGHEDKRAMSPQPLQPTHWSVDGRVVLYTTAGSKTGLDVWALPMTGDGRASPILQSTFNESDAHLSPDGRWLAYVSNESGRDEIYVQPFAQPTGKWMVSGTGATHPQWRRDGRELVFLSSDGQVMAAPFGASAGDGLRLDTARPLFSMHGSSDVMMTWDARRFLVQAPIDLERRPELHVVLNWMTELR
jgi:Tol biopolymer transport system component